MKMPPSPGAASLSRLEVRVQPNARRSELTEIDAAAARIRVRLAAPPVDGKANEALAEYLAELLGLRRSALNLLRGEKAREKLWEIHGLSREQLTKRLEDLATRP